MPVWGREDGRRIYKSARRQDAQRDLAGLGTASTQPYEGTYPRVLFRVLSEIWRTGLTLSLSPLWTGVMGDRRAQPRPEVPKKLAQALLEAALDIAR